MITIDAVLMQRLEKKGIAADLMAGFVRDVMVAHKVDEHMELKALNQRLHLLGWDGVELDHHTLQIIIAHCEAKIVTDDSIQDEKGLFKLLDKIHHERGVDFRNYAKTTLARRIGRRLQANAVATYSEYSRLLDLDSGEYARLFNDLFINVTRFLRNEAAFKALGQAISARRAENPLRIWSAGCATGQEPYTVAMLLMDLKKNDAGIKDADVSIVATDIDAPALAQAREGLYDPSVEEDLPDQWRHDFFTLEAGGLRVRPELKKMISFETHNLAGDPPYPDLDIVVCRNILIYFNPALQVKVINKFHQGLKPGGFLLLGRYEMLLNEARRKFRCLDFDARLYARK